MQIRFRPKFRPIDWRSIAEGGRWESAKRALFSVMAAFFGVQSASNMERDVAEGRPWYFIVAAALMTIALVTALALAVNFFWGAEGDPSPIPAPSSIDGQKSADAAKYPFIAPEDTLSQRLAACVSCHSDDKLNQQEGFIPSLKGKPKAYLYNQLKHFQLGNRPQSVMRGMLENLSDEYLWEIAGYFAAMPLHAPPVADSTDAPPAHLERGEQLVRHGDAAAGIPACDSCHGQALAGQLPATPALLGLPEHYILAQLGAWKNGIRNAAKPDCMGKIAQRLSPNDMQAAAAWLSIQPQQVQQAAPAAGRLPEIDCGLLPGPKQSVDVPESVESEVTRGAYLAKVANCSGCHSPLSGPAFSGGEVLETEYGNFYPPNITPDPEHGIGGWQPEHLWSVLNKGLGGDGRRLYPICPYPSYSGIVREDSDAIFAHLQSLPAAAKPSTAHDIAEPYQRKPLLGIWRAMFYEPLSLNSAKQQGGEQPSKEWQRGRYLVKAVAHCDECHAERNALGAKQDADEAEGRLIDGWHAGSLNAADAAGMQDWTLADIQTFLQSGRTDSVSAAGPMARVVQQSLQYLSDDDARSMAVYLKSLALEKAESPVAMVRAPKALAQRQMPEGRRVYQQHCQDCHGLEGQGTLAAVALAGNHSVNTKVSINLIRILVQGGFAASSRQNPRPFGMPAFGQVLSDSEQAAVLTFIRNSWGNAAAAVSPVDVARYGNTD